MKRKVFGLFIFLLAVSSVGASIIASELDQSWDEVYIAASLDIEDEYEIICITYKNTTKIVTSELSELLNVDEGAVIHTPSSVTRIPASEMLESLIGRREARNCVYFDELLKILFYTSLHGGYVYTFYFNP